MSDTSAPATNQERPSLDDVLLATADHAGPGSTPGSSLDTNGREPSAIATPGSHELVDKVVGDEMLTLSLTVSPPLRFRVVDEETNEESFFELYSSDHFSRTDEAKLTTLFHRHSRAAQWLDRTQNQRDMESAALKLQTIRHALLSFITNMDMVMVARLPISQQARLINEFGKQSSLGEE